MSIHRRNGQRVRLRMAPGRQATRGHWDTPAGLRDGPRTRDDLAQSNSRVAYLCAQVDAGRLRGDPKWDLRQVDPEDPEHMPGRKCECGCGVVFIPIRGTQVYSSPTCRARAKAARAGA